MGHQLYNHPRQLNLSTSLAILPGAKAYFYVSGTSTPATVYQNASLTTPHAVPVVADAAGVFAPIYLDSSVLYKVELQDTNGAVQSGYPVDPCNDLLPQSGNTLTQVTGTNTIEGTLSPDQALVAGLEVTIIPVATNTSAVTLELNSSGAVLDVLNADRSACTGGELVIGIPAKLILDDGGDDWVIVNPVARNAGFSNCSTPYTTLSTDRDKIKQLIIGGANTLTIDATLAGGRFRYFNATGSSTTVNVSSGTLNFYNGSSPPTGARTLAAGGYIDILVIGGGITYCTGVGIT